MNGGNGGNGGNGSSTAVYDLDRAGDGGGGGAGGAGGFIVLQAGTVQVTGSLQALGGNGGNYGSAGSNGGGAINGHPGGGGGGGRIALISPNPVVGVLASSGSNASGSTGGTPTVSIQTPECTPAVSGIQANGVVTNTIIAGTTGYIAIYGTCLGNATSAQADGTGLQFPSMMYTADGQVNVSYSCTACTSASGGIHNVTITTVNGTSGAGSGAQVFVTTVTLQSFSFTGSSQYFRDCNGAETLINPPTYPATSSGACPQVLGFGTYGDHAVYPAGSAMAGLAVFGVNPIPAQSVPGVYVQGATSGYGTFTPTGSVSIPAGQPTFSAPVQDATAFPSSQTQFINPLNINWSVAQAGSSCAIGTSYTCVSASTSSNPIYVTLANSVLPATYNGITNPVMLTYVQLAVGNGGATSQNGAFLDTWLQFTGATVTTWDGRSMQYYTGGNSSCAQTSQNLVQNLPTPSGQCAAFAILLQSALAINGIHSNFVQVLPLYASPPGSPPVLMVIKEWCFLGTPNCAVGTPYYSNRYAPGYAPPWIYRMFLNPISSGDYMYLPLSSYGDLTNMQGVPGQKVVSVKFCKIGHVYFDTLPIDFRCPTNQASVSSWVAQQRCRVTSGA